MDIENKRKNKRDLLGQVTTVQETEKIATEKVFRPLEPGAVARTICQNCGVLKEIGTPLFKQFCKDMDKKVNSDRALELHFDRFYFFRVVAGCTACGQGAVMEFILDKKSNYEEKN